MRALLYAPFLHIYEPDVDIFAVPVSPILHLGLVADVFRTTSMTMLTTVIVQLTYLFFTCPLYCMLLFVHIYIPGVHMYGVPVLLLIPHGLVVDADCTTSMMMPTTEWCYWLIFSHVRALLYAPSLHMYEPDVLMYGVAVSLILHHSL